MKCALKTSVISCKRFDFNAINSVPNLDNDALLARGSKGNGNYWPKSE